MNFLIRRIQYFPSGVPYHLVFHTERIYQLKIKNHLSVGYLEHGEQGSMSRGSSLKNLLNWFYLSYWLNWLD